MSYFEIRSEKLSTPALVALLQEAVELKYTPQEYRACQIGLLFDKIRSEFFPGPYTCLSRTSDKRKSKAFPYFFKLAEMENLNRGILPDISIYLRGQLEMFPQTKPHYEGIFKQIKDWEHELDKVVDSLLNMNFDVSKQELFDKIESQRDIIEELGREMYIINL